MSIKLLISKDKKFCLFPKCVTECVTFGVGMSNVSGFESPATLFTSIWFEMSIKAYISVTS